MSEYDTEQHPTQQDNPEAQNNERLSDSEPLNASEHEPLEDAPSPLILLEEQVAQLKDQLLRTHAEMENVRRRASDDVSKAHKFAIEKFADSLLPVQESLEKALADNSGDLNTLREGVELTFKQLSSALEKGGVVVVDPKGELFDPHLHQAISATPSELPANTVIEVLQKGYKIADRVLRPALVIVAASSN
ncbi:nucleotide exchange factor GrpE [Hydromonas duriensis]|uniref:Protein GrpE n=1 Tax=Hydromonas duriensis TaxID=1527608 RepID=A0A4R6Y628_9BURK|nr:nucleotide exchange factor GrpE [Hydromonas duriensis]TDR30755.1 molecular chaperone GrpE [Hydromonas duriensis]